MQGRKGFRSQELSRYWRRCAGVCCADNSVRVARWWAALFLTVGLLGWAGVDPILGADPSNSGQNKPVPVGVVPVRVKDVNPATEYVGHVEALQTVDLRARVEGFLQEVRFREGARVRAGDVLYVIEQDLYKARVEASKAQVAQAEAALDRADRYLKRLRAARAESVPATDMDNAVTARAEAAARLQAAKAQLAIDQLQLSYTVVTSPITGRIGRTAYTVGNLVGPSSGVLARIVQEDPIRVVYGVSENDVAAVQAALREAASGKNNRVLAPSLRLLDGTAYASTGTVQFVDNQVDPSTGTIAVRAVFPNPDGLLIPGQYVTVLVKARDPNPLPVVPQSAVLVDQKGHYVLIVDASGTVAARYISLGPTLGTEWAVTSGLVEGEQVIVQGLQKVRPGQTVRPEVLTEQRG
ncbi:efflux RND transporter periplasmic adaptor subunit [Desulfosoma caldarium]|uniref:Membrane fusion protein (Multidrug efflux system) n=1 Tax=Desulfosoma caldarium TaxID=610254 RepID=A0A3N1UKC1_9BACT|nr:efflux RND transporter periplasmic adaptor subunit [Desulfosoma caldarium]ROQ89829.1 membrane fusion protein (multidrug efflux system) [Desulfosoma caldarium]